MDMPSTALRTEPGRLGLSDATLQPESEDRRICSRSQCGLSVTLIGGSEGAIAPCVATDVSESGIRVRAPAGHRIAVGHRLEVFLYRDRPGGAGPEVVSDGHFATVVRTETGDGTLGGTVAVALCFDQPLFL